MAGAWPSADSDGVVSLVDVGTLRKFSTAPRDSGRPLSAMRFLPGGRLLAVAGFDGLLTRIRLAHGRGRLRRLR